MGGLQSLPTKDGTPAAEAAQAAVNAAIRSLEVHGFGQLFCVKVAIADDAGGQGVDIVTSSAIKGPDMLADALARPAPPPEEKAGA